MGLNSQLEVVDLFGSNGQLLGKQFKQLRVVVLLDARCVLRRKNELVLIVRLGSIKLILNQPKDRNKLGLLIELEVVVDTPIHCPL